MFSYLDDSHCAIRVRGRFDALVQYYAVSVTERRATINTTHDVM